MQVEKVLKECFVEVLENIEPAKLVKNKCKFSPDSLIIDNNEIRLPANKKIHLD